MDEVIRFTEIKAGNVKVEIWGDSITDYGVMDVNSMTPFLQNPLSAIFGVSSGVSWFWNLVLFRPVTALRKP
jgi:hypothetical protein